MFIKSTYDLHSLYECHFTLLAYLQYKKLVLSEKTCSNCASECVLYEEFHDFDNLISPKDNYCNGPGKLNFEFRCTRKYCGFKQSIRNNTWFSATKLDFVTALNICWYFVENIKGRSCAHHLNITENTVVDWYNFCREVCIVKCLNQNQTIGGPKKIVEIDESKFGKSKYNRGRYVEGQWVFGGVERGPGGRCFLVPVENRSAETLTAIIRERILPGKNANLTQT